MYSSNSGIILNLELDPKIFIPDLKGDFLGYRFV